MRNFLRGCALGAMLFASAGVVGASPAGQPSLGELHGQAYYYLMTQTVNVDLKAKLDEAHRLIVTGQDNRYAIAILDEIIKLDKSISEAFLLRGMAKTNVDAYQEADKDYEAALMLEPENPCLYYFRGMNRFYHAVAAMGESYWYDNTGNHIYGAKKMFDNALGIDPHYLDAQVGLADCYALDGDREAKAHANGSVIQSEDRALKSYEKALSIYNHVLVLVPRHDVIRSRKEDVEGRIAAYKAEQEKKRQAKETKRRINETRRRING